MKTLGLYLFIFGLASFLLNFFNLDFRILGWIDNWGSTNGILIRLGMVVGGILLMVLHKEKKPEEQFPELREINKLQHEHDEDLESTAQASGEEKSA